MPLPVPPRTPTPPTPTQDEPQQRDLAPPAPQQQQQQPRQDWQHYRHAAGLGLQSAGPLSPQKTAFDAHALSPMAENFPAQFASFSPQLSGSGTGSNPLSPTSTSSLQSGTSLDGAGSSHNHSGDEPSPFNFQPTTLSASPIMRSNVGQRRGHKYKHSSVSHQIFLEPIPRAPLALPASLPMPTFAECRRSMSREQRSRISWCLCHAAVAGYTWWSAQGSLALTALSHLILFDALGATLCVVVDVLGNFEVWKRSSVRHPFGLERAEVLAGFAMSVFLLFMGMDLISHNLQHVLEYMGHAPHHEHQHQRVSPGSVDVASLVAIVSTLVSALGLGNHARIGKAMRFAYIEALPSVLSNPSHFLTLSCSALLLLLPLLSVRMYIWLDRLLSSTIAVAMCVLGVRLVKSLASMLLMSYAGNAAVAGVVRDLEADPAVSAVDEARFWQVHYGLCMANLKLRARGGVLGPGDEGCSRLRDRIASLVRNRLGGGYGSGQGQRWEVSTQITLEGA
ncbi:MAG: Endoplasmic reticulum zinc transporter [Thelocarpon impressellum]|nr:MAG: Endoplasmic reticulum zinc transporter [Thelocarpon impressellum]